MSLRRAVWVALALLVSTCRRAPQRAPPPRQRPPAALVAEGRALVRRFECVRCHEIDGIAPPSTAEDCLGCHRVVHAGTFPARREDIDLWRANLVNLVDAPSLRGLETRTRASWIEHFLQHPTDLRPQLRATMPRLAVTASQAQAIAAFLTARDDVPGLLRRMPDRALVARGRALFHARACDGCHVFRDVERTMPAPAETDATRLAPDLSVTRMRARPDTLAAWIRDPARMKPGTPMPTLGVTDDEAQALASYVWFAPLRGAPERAVPPMLPLLARRVTWDEVAGRVFLRTCRHCHADTSLALGDGGPGNTGGFGFAPRRLELATYAGAMSGVWREGERRSVFEPDASGMPRIIHALRARQLEEIGVVEEGVRGMPLGHPAVSAEQLQLVASWIASGRPME